MLKANVLALGSTVWTKKMLPLESFRNSTCAYKCHILFEWQLFIAIYTFVLYIGIVGTVMMTSPSFA